MLHRVLEWLRSRPRLGQIMAPSENNFGLLRLAMAAAVLISHCYMHATGSSDGEPLTAWTGHSLGEHAVQVFFILSGILVAQSFERSRSLLDFLVARGLRIFPGLIVCVALTAFVLGPLMTGLSLDAYFSSPLLVTYLAKTLSLSTGSAPLPDVFTTLPMAGKVNTSLWTLKYEVLCYAVLAVAGVAGLFRTRSGVIPAALLALFVVFVFAGAPKEESLYDFTDNLRYFLLYFGMGTLAYLLRDRLIISSAFLLPLFALFVGCVGSRFGELATALFLAYGVAVFASMPAGPARRITNRLDLSFGVYIYAGPIQQALLDVDTGLHPLMVALFAALLVAPLALLSWTLVEQPSLQLRTTFRAWKSGQLATADASVNASPIGRVKLAPQI